MPRPTDSAGLPSASHSRQLPGARTLLLVATISGLILFGLWLGRMLLARDALEARLNAVSGDVASLKAENERLESELGYLQSDEGLERLARDELGWTKPGEGAVIVVGKEAPSVREAPPAPKAPENAPNWLRWWRLFFG